MQGEVVIGIDVDLSCANLAADLLNRFGLLATVAGTDDVAHIEIRAWDGNERQDPGYQTKCIELVKEILLGISYSQISNGVEAGRVEAVLIPYRIVAPLVPLASRVLEQHPTVDEMWETIRFVGSSREKYNTLSEALTADEMEEGWPEFQAYVRQAETYFRGGETMRGSAASLLFYYAFLNLAKAELCTWRPRSVVGVPVSHGLRPRTTGDVATWHSKVTPGVFSLLYEKRTGGQLGSDYRDISFVECLSRVPECGVELDEAALGQIRVMGVFSGVFTDGYRSRVHLLIPDYVNLKSDPQTHLLLLDHFDEAPPPIARDLNRDFALSSRFVRVWQMQVLISEASRGVRVGDDNFQTSLIIEELYPEIMSGLGVALEPPAFGFDGLISPSLSRDRYVALPMSLARYAAMHLISELVRYRPSELVSADHPGRVYYVDAFTRQVPLHLMADFVSHLTSPPAFMHDTSRRT